MPAKSTTATSVQIVNRSSVAPLLYSQAPALHFYRDARMRTAVMDFFISLVGSEEVALPVIYHSNKHNTSLLFIFSLMYAESQFLPNAVHKNVDSTDRGLFQLNSKSFPHLEEDDFFDPDLNAKYGLTYFQWCLSLSSSQEEAMAMYNAGYGNVKRGIIPKSTKHYIQKIYRYEENLRQEFYQYIKTRFNDVVPNFATLTSDSWQTF